MKRLIFATALGLLAALPAAAQSIGGKYNVEGTNLDGSPYKGTAEITLTSSTTCVIHWTTGGTESNGICSRNGDAFAEGPVRAGSAGTSSAGSCS